MLVNNYNQNSQGINIEGSFFYDTDLSQIYFTDSIKRLKDGSYVYVNNGNVDDEVSFGVKGQKKDLINYLEDFVGNGYDWETDSKKELLDSVDNNISVSLENFEEVSKELSNYNIKLIPSTPIEKIITRGYSQGDYAEVFYFPEKLKKVWGVKEVKEDSLKEEIDHLFWDSPIYGSITINDEELRYEHDLYKWERSKFIETILSTITDIKSEVLLPELEKMIPEEIEYI